MPSLRIPEQYRLGLSRIRDLDEATIGLIRATLDKLPPSTRPADVAIIATSSTSLEKVEHLREIIDAISSLYALKSYDEMSIESIVDGIAQGMEGLDSEKYRLSAPDVQSFKGKLATLLGAEVFTIVSKALELATDDERTFCGARVITDLRSIFGTKIEEGPKGMLVIHLLKLVFHQASARDQEFYVSLDSEDLQALKKTLERAEEKASVLKSKFKEVPFFGLS